MNERTIDTPLGPLRVIASAGAIVGVAFDDRAPGRRARAARDDVLDRAEAELREYFAGSRTAFTVPLSAPGTALQRAVWAELSKIPFGETRSYADVARAVGRPRAARAVGSANGKNPLAIIVPCHRVVGSDRALRGYAGGVGRKRWLLAHDGRFTPARAPRGSGRP
jgi:methylated-DNA-[protein]-cysteine S-methyltransferase